MSLHFFSTIAGASISFVGVLITLRWNQQLHEKNLKEEREKARKEKEYKAKQDSLIAAAEAITRYVTYYVTLADRTLPTDGIVAEEGTELGVALNRLHFYCDLETIEKATRLGQLLEEVFLETMKSKMASIFTFEEIKAIDVEIDGIERINISIQEEIKSLLQADSNNHLVVINREQLIKNLQSIDALLNKKPALFKRKYFETEKCRNTILKNLSKIYESSRDVLLLARKELSFPIDEMRYKEIMDKSIQSSESCLESLFSEMRNQFEEKIKVSQQVR